MALRDGCVPRLGWNMQREARCPLKARSQGPQHPLKRISPLATGHPTWGLRGLVFSDCAKGDQLTEVHRVDGHVSTQGGCRPQPSTTPDALDPGLLPPACT